MFHSPNLSRSNPNSPKAGKALRCNLCSSDPFGSYIVWDLACLDILTWFSLLLFPTSPTLLSVSLVISLANHLHTQVNFKNGFKSQAPPKTFSSLKGSFTGPSPSTAPPLNLVSQPSDLVIMLDFFFSPLCTSSIRVFLALPSNCIQTLATSQDIHYYFFS